MQLNELYRPNPFTPEEHEILDTVSTGEDPAGWDVQQLFLSQGWIPTDEKNKSMIGAFSIAYRNPSKPYIIKINRIFDRAFAEFMILTKLHPNVHFPRFLDVKKLKYKSVHVFKDGKINEYDHVYAYKMEKLEPISSRYLNKTEIEILAHIIFLKSRRKNQNIYQCFNALINFVADGIIRKKYMIPYFDKVNNLLHDNPSLIEAMTILGNHRIGGIDLSHGNIRKRTDGTLVFLDPFAFYRKEP